MSTKTAMLLGTPKISATILAMLCVRRRMPKLFASVAMLVSKWKSGTTHVAMVITDDIPNFVTSLLATMCLTNGTSQSTTTTMPSCVGVKHLTTTSAMDVTWRWQIQCVFATATMVSVFRKNFGTNATENLLCHIPNFFAGAMVAKIWVIRSQCFARTTMNFVNGV